MVTVVIGILLVFSSSLTPRLATTLNASTPGVAPQVKIDPESPRWDETLTITAVPAQGVDATQTFYKSDRLYATLSINRNGLFSRDTWTPLTWDGTQFVGHITVPEGCVVGTIYLATTEKMLSVKEPRFLCRDARGVIVPGALIYGLSNGLRDKENWKTDIEADLTNVATLEDSGWIYQSIWALRDVDLKNISREELLGEIEAVERKTEGKQTASLMASLVYGYLHAKEPARAFAKLAQLCQRFPESPHTVDVALRFATSNVLGQGWSEYTDQLQRLRVQVASAAPENAALRPLLSTLTADPGVSVATLERIARSWITAEPQSAPAYLGLARVLLKKANNSAEAEQALTKAIELWYLPRPFDFSVDRLRNAAYRLRSKLRAQRGDLASAIADAKMAESSGTKQDTSEDMFVEADLWGRLGYADRSEAVALRALGEGSLRADKLLRELYVSRTGGENGFADYLVARLRDAAPLKLLRPTPTFTTNTLAGSAIDAAQLRGHVTVVDFWFIDCPPCRVERPLLNKLVEELGGRVRFVGFALDSAEHLRTYLKDYPFKVEVVPDCKEVSKAFGIQAYPTHLLIDSHGDVVWESTGGGPDDLDRLRAMIYRVLAVSNRSSNTSVERQPPF